MKKCPQCSQFFEEDNDFCLNDGERLVSSTDHAASAAYYTPTQVMYTPAATPAQNSVTSPLLYMVIGILATALVAVAAFAYIFAGRSSEDKKAAEPQASPAKEQQSTPASEVRATAPAANAPPPVNPSPASPPEPTFDSSVTPTGNWSGDWVHNKRTSSFTANMELRQTGPSVEGRIVWTLTRSSNPQKMYKSGLNAVEYVRGTFDPATRLVRLRGYRKEDSNNLGIILDSYNLSISADSRSMSGTSKNGVFKLRR